MQGYIKEEQEDGGKIYFLNKNFFGNHQSQSLPEEFKNYFF
jgi:hypothetical protein